MENVIGWCKLIDLVRNMSISNGIQIKWNECFSKLTTNYFRPVS